MRIGLRAHTTSALAALAVSTMLAAPAAAAQPSPPLTAAEAAQLRAQLETLRAQARTLAEQADALEKRLDAAAPPPSAAAAPSALPAPVKVAPPNMAAAAPPPAPEAPPQTVVAASPPPAAPVEANLLKPKTWGALDPGSGKGFVLARTDKGEVDMTFITYFRYLDQTALAPTYTDYFGHTTVLDLKNDVQFQKVNLTFKGWLFTPRFRYLLFLWTNNAAQGEGAQVVIAGHLDYDFAKWLSLGVGIDALPTTRSTVGNYPNWLRNDNRLMADEFFRGSYTTGIYLTGDFSRFQYKLMAGNNLSTLGVSANQLAPGLDTYSGYLRWMPTTGEFGPLAGFGDYENHRKVATLLEAHYTYSREDAQEQPGTDTIENSQIRLSDGERLFEPNVFGTQYRIRKATYQMAAFDAAVKYRGLALESEYYLRWVNDFVPTGPLPYSNMYDTGISVQASGMILQKKLQAYATFSHIWGQFGSPNEFVTGLNWYPFGLKSFRITPNAMYFDNSPVGYAGVPYVVGGHGWAFYMDAALAAF